MRGRILVLAAALAVTACGKAAPPVPPEAKVPAPVSDLRGVTESGAVDLAWTNPQRRTDQTRVRDLVEARVYRIEDDGIVAPKPALLSRGKIAGYQEVAVIRLAAPAPAVVRGDSVRFIDREGLRVGRRYTYVVLTEDSRGRVSPPSTRFSVTLIAPPEAPAAPRVDAGDREVRIRWQPPPRLLDGGAAGPLTYEVSRFSSAEGPAEAVFALPAGHTQFLDKAVENDRTYYYSVRAIREHAGATTRGEASPRVPATPGQTTPPAPPATLVATPSGNTVRLSWAPSPDSNVEGYVVYRAETTGDFARIGATRAPATTFTDRDVRSGSYRYAVTAQDATARVNESSRSNIVTITLP